MPFGDDAEKTEQPTPKKREDAREKGHAAKSPDLASAFILLSGLVVLSQTSWLTMGRLSAMWRSFFAMAPRYQLSSENVQSMLINLMGEIFIMLFPIMLAVMLAAAASGLLQVGFMFSSEQLMPKLSRLNPIEGLKRMVSLNALIMLLKAAIKILIVGYIGYSTIMNEFGHFPQLVTTDVNGLLSYSGQASMSLGLKAGGLILALAAADYGYQRWFFEKNLRMSKHELKEELKEREGDPHLKARVRSVQREMARKRMMASVPKADVVVTNPTHLAVALKYERKKMAAPMVVAKGAGFIALKIKEIARAKGIPVIENKPLAKVLYEIVEIGAYIPLNLYKAVAEVLAYVYKLKNMAR